LWVAGYGWSFDYDIDVADNTTSFDWQGGFTVVDFPGAVGDIFLHSDSQTTGSTTLKGAKILRAAAHGLVLNERRRSADNVPLLVRDVTSNTDVGEATSDKLGYYVSLLPYAKGERSHNVSVQSGPLPRPDATNTFYPRKRQRFAFRIFQVCMGLLPGLPMTYFPFSPQFGDRNLLALEDWRRIPAAEDSEDSVTGGSRSDKAGVSALVGSVPARRRI
jgi:hypothetical protein